MINVGLIGFGFMGRTHYSCYNNLSNVRVFSICDGDVERLKNGKDIQGNINVGQNIMDFSSVKTTAISDEIFKESEIQMVDLCVPTFLHCKHTIKAAESGKHVLCEKPMARNLKEAQQMIDACKSNGTKLMIGHVLRFWGEYLFLKNAIQSGKYGNLLSIVFTRLSSAPKWAWNSWISDPKLGGEAILDLHIHDVDTALWLLGKPASVFARGKIKKSIGNGINYVVANYLYENGPVCTIEGGWIAEGDFPFTMGFLATFENGVILYDSRNKPTLCLYEKDKQPLYPSMPVENAYQKEIEYFLGCVEENKNVEEVRPETSLEAVKLVHYEKTSIKKRKVIKIV
ncbi:MAG: Gfo/Idh/MocA family oxidoreductase [Candidatus Omnitrophica bacterium]|nr:Gfo/Idh/MocA family oxidoreductase [Candidatus Omnitrophota bacterium]